MKRQKQIGGMPMHFVPQAGQQHFGRVGEPLCHDTGPQLVKDIQVWGATNTIENVTCAKCQNLFGVRNHMCRVCGTMITDTCISKYAGRCAKCLTLKDRVGIVDVDVDGVTIKTYGAAKKHEDELKKQMKEEKELKELAVAQQKAYNQEQERLLQSNQTEQSVNSKEQETMAKKTADKKSANGKGAGTAALKKANEGKRAALHAQTIKMLVKDNPKRPGTKGFKMFSLYKSGMTVGDFLGAGGTIADVRWDEKHKFIELH